MKKATTLRTPYDYNNTDSILDFFNTPEYQARVQKASQRDALLRLRDKLITSGCLVALGFILGAILV